MGRNEKKYPIILDTGTSRSIIVEQAHVLTHNLPVYSNNTSFGLCYLPELNIGKATLSNLPGLYLKQKTSPNPLELFIPREKKVIVGLEALMKFKYIMFDNPEKEVEFSNSDLFEPKELSLWTRYSFEIEQDSRGNAFLFVKVPIAGKEITLQLDTGNGKGLAITEDSWAKMPNRIKNIQLIEGQDWYPYIGKLTCKRGIIPQVELGEITVSDALVSIYPDDSPLIQDCQGLLGMQYFQDTTIVLDFERNLMWVKNALKKA